MALNAGSEPAAELRRQRQERLSGAMGQLLLRGYRMLGSCCPQCGTILLQDKQQQLLCVGCRESDSLGGTDSPSPPSPPPQPLPAAPRPEHCEGAAAALRGAPPGPAGAGGEGAALGAALGAAREAVVAKLRWAARELPRTASAEASAQLCLLVRACAEALGGLQALRPPPPETDPAAPPGANP